MAAQNSLAIEQSLSQLVLFKSETEQLAQRPRLELLNQLGVAGKLLTPEEVRAIEPALNANLAFHSGIYFAQDGVGNCRQFAHLLKEKILEFGGELNFGSPVTALSGANGPEIQTPSKGAVSFDRVVICAGASGNNLNVPEFKQVTLARVSSTSISAQIREPLYAPRSAVLDWNAQISMTRMGARVRISGGALLGHKSSRVNERTQKYLFQALQDHFPSAADFRRSMQIWQGTSIFSPDALPLIGASVSPGVWLNLAHGHNGWGMACGAARLIADQISGKSTAIDATKFHPSRFKP
jgi:D-amino-acid dehydrogenase